MFTNDWRIILVSLPSSSDTPQAREGLASSSCSEHVGIFSEAVWNSRAVSLISRRRWGLQKCLLFALDRTFSCIRLPALVLCRSSKEQKDTKSLSQKAESRLCLFWEELCVCVSLNDSILRKLLHVYSWPKTAVLEHYIPEPPSEIDNLSGTPPSHPEVMSWL